jgi:16S rRNA (guanine527-N7)-methyltransferase
VTLVEPLLRRCEFLEEVIADLALNNVTVIRSRAEQTRNLKADVVTARAVAPLERLLGWTLPLMAKGGQVLAMKGSSAADEILNAESQLRGFTAEIFELGQGIVDPLTTVVQIKAQR